MDIVVPSFGESVTEAHVARVLVKDGEVVMSGTEILELETDKVNQVITAPSSGAVYLSVKEGDSVSIGQSVGQIAASESAAAAPASDTPLSTEEKTKSIGNIGEEMKTENLSATLPEAPTQTAETRQTSKSSAHSSRKTTDDFLSSLQKSTEVTSPTPASKAKQVMSHAAPSPKESNPEIRETSEPRITTGEKRKRMTPFRMTIAKKLVEVKNQTAMLTTFNEVDMTEIMAIRSKEKDSFIEKHGVKLGFTSFFLKASVQALKAFPEIHARIEGSDIVYPVSCDIGIAVSTDRGLTVPVIRECERLSFADMEKQLARLADKARTFKLSLADLTGGTFTITNGGVFGSLLSTPILYPLQSGILGMHSIQKRVIVREDKMVIRPMMYLALSYDHRIVDGKEAVSFLVHIKDNLEEPTRLLLDF